MKGLRVSEVAERAGVAASTVRFYERSGLLSPARRSRNGYRVFDESALDELVFVQRAKGIGMSLEDIADLVAAWPTGKCQSLQARLRAYLARRISEVRQQQAELGAFERQLQTVLSRLSATTLARNSAAGDVTARPTLTCPPKAPPMMPGLRVAC